MSNYKLVPLGDAIYLRYPGYETLKTDFGYGIYLFENNKPIELLMTGRLDELEDALESFYTQEDYYEV